MLPSFLFDCCKGNNNNNNNGGQIDEALDKREQEIATVAPERDRTRWSCSCSCCSRRCCICILFKQFTRKQHSSCLKMDKSWHKNETEEVGEGGGGAGGGRQRRRQWQNVGATATFFLAPTQTMYTREMASEWGGKRGAEGLKRLRQ